MLSWLQNSIKNHKKQGLDCKIDVVKPKFYSSSYKPEKASTLCTGALSLSILILRKPVVYGWWSSIFMVLSKFWRRIFYIAFNKDTFVFLNENLGHLTLIVEKQHLNYISVGSIFLHDLGTFVTFVEPYLITLMFVQLERIYPCLIKYYDLI